jgi:hypothetical protein
LSKGRSCLFDQASPAMSNRFKLFGKDIGPISS